MSLSARISRGAAALVAAATLAALSSSAMADNGIAQLRQFVENARFAQGEFQQTVSSSSGRKPQKASGTFAFARPGKFRWVYEKPYAQVLVSDGEKLWAWDPDLNQVTIKRLGDALGSTPVAILAGEGALERDFELSEAGSSDGLAWVIAKPRLAESAFESIRLGLAGGVLRRMELRDSFGQTTLIVFASMNTGARPDPAQFRFVPPAGADVISD